MEVGQPESQPARESRPAVCPSTPARLGLDLLDVPEAPAAVGATGVTLYALTKSIQPLAANRRALTPARPTLDS